MLFVFLMQTGFAMLEVGSVDVKNTRNILLKVGDHVLKIRHTIKLLLTGSILLLFLFSFSLSLSH